MLNTWSIDGSWKAFVAALWRLGIINDLQTLETETRESRTYAYQQIGEARRE